MPPSQSIALFPAARGESAPATDSAIPRWPRYSTVHLGAYAPRRSSSGMGRSAGRYPCRGMIASWT